MAQPQGKTRRPMEIHDDLEEYFRVLHEDPYGLENPDYDWDGENRFVAIAGSAPTTTPPSSGSTASTRVTSETWPRQSTR